MEYIVKMPLPHSHYFEVAIQLAGIQQDYIDFKMPVWIPGSYLVREFAKNVEGFMAMDKEGKCLQVHKINKSTWRVNCGQATVLRISYMVYAFELTVRTSHLDGSHAFINPAGVLMYIDGLLHEPATLTIEPYAAWQTITTPLKPVGSNPFVLAVPDYNTLVDSPIEIGNHEVLTFEAVGVRHEVAMYGQASYHAEKLKADMQAVAEAAASIIGEHPCQSYTFIIHHLQTGFGGLEHQNATALQVARNAYESTESYRKFLSLVAHEYFHLWNVKRIRPFTLGPFDYEAENYTTLLWMAEGFTSYYDDFIVRKAALISPEQYLETVACNINTVENTPGSYVQPLSEASFDAWIKYYRPNENSKNAQSSYYVKGSVVAMLLDLEIIYQSAGQYCLDDVMRLLYITYYKQQGRGFTETELYAAIEHYCGCNMAAFYDAYVHGTTPIAYHTYLAYAGLNLLDQANKQAPELGIHTKTQHGKTLVTSVLSGSPAYEAGIYAHDELIAIDGQHVGANWHSILDGKQIGEKLTVTVSRFGLEQNIEVVLAASRQVDYKIEKVEKPTAAQRQVFRKWMRW